MQNTYSLKNLLSGIVEMRNFLIMHKRVFFACLLLIVCIQFVAQILMEVECTSQDISVRGLRVFEWAKSIFPGKYESLTNSPVAKNVVLFSNGPAHDIDGKYVIQGAVYDCRFLSSLAAFASSRNGKEAIPKMINQNSDGGYTVTFPCLQAKPITIEPLTEMEVRLYGHLQDRVSGENKGMWLAVIEKAFGKYRSEHLDPYSRFLLFCKHAIFEFRFTSAPELVGFGAAYGSKDDSVSILLNGRPLKLFWTWGFELGQVGLGKGYVTWRQVRSWFNRSMLEQEYEDEQHKALVRSLSDGGIANAATELSIESQEHGLHVGHAFSVLGYDPVHRVLRICDPMGKGDYVDLPSGKIKDGVNDGVFLLSLHDFNHCFSHLGVSEPAKTNISGAAHSERL